MRIQNLPFRGYFYAAFTIVAIGAVLTVLAKFSLPPVVPLLYGRPVGTGQLVPALALLIIPGSTLLVTLINMFLATKLSNDFLKKILAASSLFISILGIITLIKIILLVGFW